MTFIQFIQYIHISLIYSEMWIMYNNYTSALLSTRIESMLFLWHNKKNTFMGYYSHIKFHDDSATL